MTPANRRLDPPSAGDRRAAADSRRGASPSSANRWLSAVRTVFGASLVMATSIGLAWTVRHYMTHSPRFSVTEIRVVGGVRRSADAVIAESGLSVATNVFSIDLDVARNNIAGRS